MTTISKRLHGMALAVLILGMMAGSAQATSISYTGTGGFNGGGLSVAVSSTCINFYNGASPDMCTGTTDSFTVGAPVDPSLPFHLNDTGTIGDITTSPIVGWMTIGTVNFDLENIIMPAASPCPPGMVPGSCSAGDFVLTQLDTSSGSGNGNVTVSFSLNAIAYTGMSSTGFTPYSFSFSSQFTDTNVSAILTEYLSGAPVLDSVSFTASPSAVPEPAAFLLLGSGLVGLGLLGRRVRRNR